MINRALLVLSIPLMIVVAESCSYTPDYFYDLAIARNPKNFLKAVPDLDTSPKSNTGLNTAWIDTQSYETVSIKSDDGLLLVAYYLPAEKASEDVVILLHGYASRGLEMSEFAKFYHSTLGYNVLMPDARGHGASGGDYIGFGWPDRRDYLSWVNWLVSKDKRVAISLHGISMGGAAALMLSGEELPLNVKAIVEDCGYTSVDDELAYQLKRIYHIESGPSILNLNETVKRRAGYSMADASAIDQVRKSKTPILFIHGDADKFVPFEMAQRLYDACPSEKELFVVHGAGHGESALIDPDGYKGAVGAFLKRYVDEPMIASSLNQ